MKLTCDLCGGTLLMKRGGQEAACTQCGISYSIDRLREKLAMNNVATNTTPPQLFMPKQFIMEVSHGSGDISGRVKQGGIGLGDRIYINNDYSKSYTIYSLCDDSDVVCVKEGMSADLYLQSCPKAVLRNARVVTGDPDPEANAYNFNGTVQQYFMYVLQKNFEEFEIRANVSFNDIRIPVSYLLSSGGKPVLAVFLINSNDSSARYSVKKAAGILGKNGISCVHFFDNYRNDESYVISRIDVKL